MYLTLDSQFENANTPKKFLFLDLGGGDVQAKFLRQAPREDTFLPLEVAMQYY